MFREDTLWYGMLPPGPGERTLDDLAGLHDGPERKIELQRRVADVITVREVVAFPADCVAYVIGAGRRVDTKILLPPDDCSLRPPDGREERSTEDPPVADARSPSPRE